MVENEQVNTTESVMKSISDFNSKLLEERKEEQQVNIVNKAQSQIENFNTLNNEINEDMRLLNIGIQVLGMKIKKNLKNDENKDGLLTRPEEDYLQCLELKKDQLDELLRQDEAYWAENLDLMKKEAEKLQEKAASDSKRMMADTINKASKVW